MADKVEKVIVQIDISDSDAEKKLINLKGRAAEYSEENKKLVKQLKELEAQGKGNSVEFQNLEKFMRQNEIQIKSLGQEARIYERILVSSTTAQRAAEGSMFQSMAALSALTAQYKNLTAEQRDNTEEGKNLKAEIESITATLKKQEAELGDNRRNVGNYASAFDGITEKVNELNNLNIKVNAEGFAKSEQEINVVKAQLFEMGRTAIASATTIGELQKVVQSFADASVQATGSVKEELANIAKEAKAKIDEVNGLLKDGQKQTENLGNKLEDFAKGFVAAFTVDRFIGFLNDSADAFAQAEDNARKLDAAVGSNGGLSSDFDNLVAQSAELQKHSIFSDDDIQKAQTFALNAGLSADQVKRLIPQVADFASRTGQDLSAALDKVIGGMNGQGKALKDYGIIVDASGDRISRLTDISEQLNKKFKDGAQIVADDAVGSIKQYENEVDDLMEKVGEKYLPVLQTFKLGLLGIANDLGSIFSGDKFKAEGAAKSIEEQRARTERLAATLDTATVKQNAFNLSVGVSSLISQRDQLQAGTKEYEAVTGALNSALGALQAYNAEIKSRSAIAATAQIKAETDLTKLTTAELKNRLNELKASNLAADQDTTDAINAELEKRTKAAEERIKIDEKAAAAFKTAADKLRGIAEKDSNDVLQLQSQSAEERLKIQEAAELKEIESAYQQTNKLAEAQQLREEAITAVKKKYELLNDQAVKDAFAKLSDELNAELDKENEILSAAEEKKKKAKEEAKGLEQQFIQDDYQNQLDALDEYYKQVIYNTELSEEKRNAIISAIGIKRQAIQAESFANNLSQFGSFFNSASQLAKKNSFEQKAFAIGATTIDTYVGAQKAFNSQFIPGDPTSLVRAILAASAATITGLARVKQIASTKEFYEGGFNYEGFTEQSGNPKLVSRKSNSDRTVHHEEYIAPARVLNTPEGRYHVNQLEVLRTRSYGSGTEHLASRSFEQGGLFLPPTLSQLTGATVNVKGISAEEVVSIVQATVSSMKPPVLGIQEFNAAADSFARVEERANF